MKNEALYNRTVDILVQAYFNDTLQHGNCKACAVGNICMANGADDIKKKYPRAISWYGTFEGWASVFYTDRNYQELCTESYKGLAKEVIDATGYTLAELASIEYAFETAPQGDSEDEYMFNGLMAVIDTLDIIHENTDPSISSQTKERFNKQLA